MTKDTDGYLDLKILTKSYLQGGRMTKDTNEYLVFKILVKSYL